MQGNNSLMESIGDSMLTEELKYSEGVELLAEIIKDAICKQQKLLAEFVMHESPLVKDIEKIEDISELEDKIISFFDFFQESLEAACDVSVTYLNKYFELDGRHVPRITIKGLRRNDKRVIDYYRSDGDTYYYAFRYQENTAFKDVNHRKKHYFSNNIPADAKSGLYENKRLIKSMVESYILPEIDLNIKYLSHDEYNLVRDKNWERCWNSYNKKEKPSIRSCYKSTLVVPIALSHINIATKKKLMIHNRYDSAIFGYLCFDDVCIEYFELPRDMYIGYIFSDILSLYIVAMNYFEYGTLKEKISRLDNERSDWKDKTWKIKCK